MVVSSRGRASGKLESVYKQMYFASLKMDNWTSTEGRCIAHSAMHRPLQMPRIIHILGRFRCEGEGNDNFIFRNCYVGQVWRLDADVCNIISVGCGSCDRIAYDFPLHIKDFFVGFAVHGQVTSELKMNRLAIGIA